MIRTATLMMAVSLMFLEAQAAVVETVDFESPTYAIGGVDGQGSWTFSSASNGDPGPYPETGNIQDVVAHGGSQALSTVRNPTSSGSRWEKADFTPLSTDGDSVDWWAQRTGLTTALFFIGESPAVSHAAINVGWRIESGRSDVDIFWRDGSKRVPMEVETALDVWYHFTTIYDFTNQTMDLLIKSEDSVGVGDPGYVDASALAIPFKTAQTSLSAFQTQAQRGEGEAHFTDDITFTAMIPEPSGLCLLGLGLVGLLSHRRRGRK